VTLRRIWMEQQFIFEEIKKLRPDEIFHDVSKYCFLWRPPDSSFKICVPLDSEPLLEEALVKYSKMTPPGKKFTFFHFTTIDATMPMFAPKVSPLESLAPKCTTSLPVSRIPNANAKTCLCPLPRPTGPPRHAGEVRGSCTGDGEVVRPLFRRRHPLDGPQ
jgi:hypothetical protein